MSKDEITRTILSYFVRHPDAGDTLQGFVEWWIAKEKIEASIEQVSEVVSSLVRRQFLIEREIGSGQKVYFVNKEKLAEIKNFIQTD